MFEGRDPSASWQIRQGDDWLVSMLLWVRDACGLAALASPDLPPCRPVVSARTSLSREQAEDAAQAWSHLWAAAVRDTDPMHARLWPDPSDEASLVGPEPGTGHLRQVLSTGREELWDWQAAGRTRQPGDHRTSGRDPVRPHEQRLGRRARPFRLEVLELPVTGRHGWVLDDTHVLLSAELAADGDACAAFLEPVIARLV